ncbi:hypothetical protein CC86DRAFT_468072 [Ophiobolus disseminans]|uniref:Ubiquitin-like protease family profile domain-containing protein n=1 Tax=Ophiobolus disseminans TaxID=1469910 RepID=A0A6A6ZVA3_9PLEO|nr:hypothetical protein CC86DRAFT_468072 [Ophiobolus disseminans]
MHRHIQPNLAYWRANPLPEKLKIKKHETSIELIDDTCLPNPLEPLQDIQCVRFKNMHIRTEWRRRSLGRRSSIDANTASNLGNWEDPTPLPVVKNIKDDRDLETFTYSGHPDPLYQKYTPKNISDRDSKCLEMAHATLFDPAFFAITQTGGRGWFHNQTIDFGFEMLERIVKCDEHRLALSNVGYATDLCKIGHRILAEAEVAREFKYLYEELHHLDADAKTKFQNKDFIILPINDGYPNALRDPTDKDNRIWHTPLNKFREAGHMKPDSGGRHWSFIIVDCRSDVLTGHYLDSLHNTPNFNSLNHLAAHYVLRGLQLLLNDSGHKYGKVDLKFERNAPLQGRHNANRGLDGGGACGPFVWLMAKEYSQYIVECRHEDNAAINLDLPRGYAQRLQWDSARTRKTMQNLVNRELRTRLWLTNTTKWLDEITDAKRPGFASWLKSRGYSEGWFWDSYEGLTWM